ncbi:MAG: DUF192 domain-containing protein [Candidatus Altiarchaeota archaeon]|nr:DUF192 domain-containing protein [Candidatus Altiarchaeota archaeon]
MEPRPRRLFILSFVLLLLSPLIGLITKKNIAEYETTKLKLGSDEFELEIADTRDKQIKGLMNRDELGDWKGMLFVFEPATRPAFWMRNVRFPIDIIFIDQQGIITEIWKNQEPCGFVCTAQQPAELTRYVIEINTGASSQISIGDKIRISLP